MPTDTPYPQISATLNNFKNRMQAERSKIIGTGIVCGFDVFMDEHCHICIYNGVGLSSTGLSICQSEDQIFHYCRPYPDPDGYFKERMGGEVNIFELLERPSDGTIPLTPQGPGSNSGIKSIEDKVVVLYVERDPHHPIPLLLDQEDAWKMLQHSKELHLHCILTEKEEEEAELSIFNSSDKDELPSESELYNAVHKKFLLNDIRVKRFGFSQAPLKDIDPTNGDLHMMLSHTTPPDTFENMIMEYCMIITDALQQLNKGIKAIHEYYAPYIDAYHMDYLEDYFKAFLIRWANFQEEENKESIQYVYDFVKDLVVTYNELRREVCDLMADCNPDRSWHPRHLMLGKVQDEVLFQPSIYRHYFRQPPVYNDNQDRLQKVRMLHWRMVVQFKCFFIPGFENEDFSDEHYAVPLKEKEVLVPDSQRVFSFKITPSRGLEEALGRQSIPYYYFLSRSLYSLQHYWDYEMTSCNKEDHHFSYHASYDDDSYTHLDSIIHPFAFSVNEYSFYRMEGHIGRLAEDLSFNFPLGGSTPSSPYDPNQFKVEIKSNCPLATAHFNFWFSLTELHITIMGLTKNAMTTIRNNLNLNFDLDDIDITNGTSNELVNFTQNDQLRGMEHIGGVKRGGTWVFITMDKDIEFEITVTDNEQGNERKFSHSDKGKTIVADFYYPGKCKPNPDLPEYDSATKLVNSKQNTDAVKNLEEEAIQKEGVEVIDKKVRSQKQSKGKSKTTNPAKPKKAISKKKVSKINQSLVQDLKKIKGIDQKTEKALNRLGFTSYQQIYELLDVEKAAIAKSLKIDLAKIDLEDWSGQAKNFLKE